MNDYVCKQIVGLNSVRRMQHLELTNHFKHLKHLKHELSGLDNLLPGILEPVSEQWAIGPSLITKL